MNSKYSKQKGEKLGERTFEEEHKLVVGHSTTLSTGGGRDLKADSVLDNWNDYTLSEYSFQEVGLVHQDYNVT